MKIATFTSTSFLVLFSLLVPIIGFAQNGGDSPVVKEMDALNRSFKKLGRQFADPAQKASSLELVASIQKNVENSKTLTPSKAEKTPNKKKYMDTFHKDLDDLSKELGALKDAISADKTDVAKAELDKIGKLKMSSHKELGVGGGGGRRGPGEPGGPPPPPNANPAPAASPSPAM